MTSSYPPRMIAVRINGDRQAAASFIAEAGGVVDEFDYTVDYATGAALIVARDLDGVLVLERLLAKGLAVPVQDLPRRRTARSMPRMS